MPVVERRTAGAQDLQVDNFAQLSTGFNCTVPPEGARETARILRLSQMNSSLNLSPLRLSAPLLLKCPRVSLLDWSPMPMAMTLTLCAVSAFLHSAATWRQSSVGSPSESSMMMG